MHPHLTLILSSQMAKNSGGNEPPHLADMDIIGTQALLMQAGGICFNAMKSGEISGILAGMVALAYHALQAVAALQSDIDDYDGEKYLSYQIVDIMRQLSNKINDCASGEPEDYSRLYHVCHHLSTDFLNADFDKAFKVYHEWYTSHFNAGINYDAKLLVLHQSKLPDLTYCLYE